MHNEIMLCDFHDCKLYLSDPTTLPCGFTICRQHLDRKETYFNCKLCNNDHLIRELRINVKLFRIIESNFHLNGLHLKAKQIFDQIKISIDKFEKTILADPLKFTKAYFNHNIKSFNSKKQEFINNLERKKSASNDLAKILEIDEMIKVANEKCNKFTEDLKKIQDECEENVNLIIAEAFNLYDFDNGEQDENFLNHCEHDLFRRSNLTDQQLKEAIKRLNLIYNKLELRFNDFKNRLLMNKNIDITFNNYEIDGPLNLRINHDVSFDCGNLHRIMHDSFMNHFNIAPDHVHSILVVDSLNILITGSGSENPDNSDNKKPRKKDSYRIKIWNLLNGQLLRTIIGAHTSRITAIIDRIESNQFLTCSLDRSIKIWDLFTHKMISKIRLDLSKKINLAGTQILKICLLPKNQLAIYTSDGYILIIDLVEKKEIKKFQAHEKLMEMKICYENIILELSRDSSRLISSDSNGSIKLWNSRNFVHIRSIEGKSMTLTPNGDKMIIISKDDEKRTLKIWNFDDETFQTFQISSYIIGNSLRALTNNLIAISCVCDKDESNLNNNGHKFKIAIFDIDDIIELKCLNAHRDQINCMSSSKQFLFSGSNDQTISMWKI